MLRVMDQFVILFECGVGGVFDRVIVNGEVSMGHDKIPGLDFATIRQEAQRIDERVWNTLP